MRRCKNQSYVIKSAPWTILWFRILGIFSVENIKRLCVFMFQTCSNSQLLRRVLWISAEQTIGASLKHKNTQPLYIFSRVRVLHLNRLKERTWLHSFVVVSSLNSHPADWGSNPLFSTNFFFLFSLNFAKNQVLSIKKSKTQLKNCSFNFIIFTIFSMLFWPSLYFPNFCQSLLH